MATTARRAANRKKRAAYRERRRAQLHEWSAKMDLWKARGRKAKAEVKIRYREGVEDVNDALDSMRGRLNELDEAREESWEEIREGVDRAAAEARKTVRRVSERLER